MISFISSFQIIDVFVRKGVSEGQSDTKFFFYSDASVADAAVNPNGIKSFLANAISSFCIKVKLVLNNRPRSLPKTPRDCRILCNWGFDNFILEEELFTKVLHRFETSV